MITPGTSLVDQNKHDHLANSQGMDKILWGMGNGSGTVEVTNDGATILRSVGVDNPAAKVLEIFRTFSLISVGFAHKPTFRYLWRCPGCRTARLGTERPQ